LYDSRTDKGRGTTHTWCEHCDWGRHGRSHHVRRARLKRAWFTEAWLEATHGDMHPNHANLPVFI
jgi:hypothetical protein